MSIHPKMWWFMAWGLAFCPQKWGESPTMRLYVKKQVPTRHTHTHTPYAQPKAGILCCVGWDYLCDWISEKRVPEDNTVLSLHTTTPGVCLSLREARAVCSCNNSWCTCETQMFSTTPEEDVVTGKDSSQWSLITLQYSGIKICPWTDFFTAIAAQPCKIR